MTFIWPVMLWSLLLIPLFVALYLSLQQRRKRVAARYGSLGYAGFHGWTLLEGRYTLAVLFEYAANADSPPRTQAPSPSKNAVMTPAVTSGTT